MEVPTQVVLDWDDTLFGSTWFERYRHRLTREDLVRELRPVDQSCVELLTLIEASPNVKVQIISNAELAWIELCLQTYYPRLSHYLKTSSIQCISARDLFGHTCECNIEWKFLTMNHLKLNLAKHVISIGDGDHERIATHRLGVVTKTIKMMERPQLKHLLAQHHIIKSSWMMLLSTPQKLDLQLRLDFIEEEPDTPPLAPVSTPVEVPPPPMAFEEDLYVVDEDEDEDFIEDTIIAPA